MSKPEKAKEARILRGKGMSLANIASRLEVSKSSVSAWCQEVHLSEEQKIRLRERQISAGHIGRLRGAQTNKDKRQKKIDKYKLSGKRSIGLLSSRDLLLLGVGLYWGEGAKTKTDPVSLVNSDPALLRVGKRWLCNCFSVSPHDLRPYIYISEQHKDRKDKIVDYWTATLGLSRKQYKVIFLKNRPKKKYVNHDDYYGVVALRVCKSSELKYQILGLIDASKQG